MKNIFERHDKLKESIGEFILAFSELEFGLGILCSYTEFDLLQRNISLPKFIGMTFENKKRAIEDYIKNYEPELIDVWKKIDLEMKYLTEQRRFIAHGIESVYVSDNLRAIVKVGNGLKVNNVTIDKVKEWTNRLQHVNTGDNGILGEFHIDFVTRSINRWNRYVIEEYRLTYKVNDKIVTEWKGINK
jgi:hypothetical protein